MVGTQQQYPRERFLFLFHRKVRPMKQKGMRSFARGTKAAPAGKLGRGSVRSALLFCGMKYA